MDGELHGALPPCSEIGCKGRLKLENGAVVCGGSFNDDVKAFVKCYFRSPAAAVSRLQWRIGPKSEDELRLENSFKSSVAADPSDSNLFADLDLNTMAGKKAAAEKLIQAAAAKGINVPSDDREAKVRFGSIIINNPGKPPGELLLLAEEMFGSKVATKAKQENSKTGTLCEENAGLEYIY